MNSRADLETQTIAAHRAYLDALGDWERLHDAGVGKHDDISRQEAEARKEVCRIRFRELVNRLGYLPRLHGKPAS